MTTNISYLPLNYILYNNAAILFEIVKDSYDKSNNNKDEKDIIDLFIGKWFYKNYVSCIYKDKEFVNENGEIIKLNKKLNINISKKLISPEGSKYFFLSLIYLKDNIKYLIENKNIKIK